ncbi:MAG TPA: lipopolysaccharide biosynthesis protein [Hyphomicrobiaceae bacterium]|nr:lipopolysaccharide biosynthesis protein [Hyphomicrobiaceae bacterium]
MPTSMAQRLRRRAAAFRQRPLVREGLWVVAGHGVTAVAGLVSIRLFTELAPQSVFGAANLLLGMLTLGMHALLAPITQTQIRYHSAYNDAGDGDAYTRLIARLAAGAAAAIIVLVSAALLLWPGARGGAGLSVIGWLAAWVGVSAWRGVLINRAQAERQQKRFALWVGTEALLTMGCTGGTLALWPTVEGFIAGQVMGLAIAALIFGSPAFLRAGPPIGADMKRVVFSRVATYGLPFAPLSVLGWVSNLSERYILVAYFDTATVGLYVAAFAIANRLPQIPSNFLADLLRPVLFEAQGRGQFIVVRKVIMTWLSGLTLIAALSIAVVIQFGDLIAYLLLEATYRAPAIQLMPWIVGSAIATTFTMALDQYLMSHGRSRVLLIPKTIAPAASLACSVALIPQYGLVGAALAHFAGQAAQLLTTILLVAALRRPN